MQVKAYLIIVLMGDVPTLSSCKNDFSGAISRLISLRSWCAEGVTFAFRWDEIRALSLSQ